MGKEFPLLKPVATLPANAKWGNDLTEYTLFDADESIIERIIREQPKTWQLVIRGEEALHINLIAHNPYSDGFFPEVIGKGGSKVMKLKAGAHFRGTIEEYPGSQLGLSVWGNEVFMVAFGGGLHGNLVLGRIGSRRSTEKPVHVLYNDHDLNAKNPFHCGSHAGLEKNVPSPAAAMAKNRVFPPVGAPTTCKAVKKYFECDYKMYQDFNFDTSAVVNFTAAMFSVTQILYENEQTKAVINKVKVWSVPDSFDYSQTSFIPLGQFANAMSNGFSGDLAHLISTVNAGLGGVAYLGVLCLGVPYYQTAFSNIDVTYNTLPTYSWTVNVVAHEMGHNFGSRHTQNCGWDLGNGVSGMLDSCFTAEGGCYTGPRIPTAGTIMSYCHITGRVDLSLGFGPQPGAVVKMGFDSATCLGNGIVIAPVAIQTPLSICAGSSVTITSSKRQGASYIWEGPGGFVQTTSDSFLVIPSFNNSNFGDWFLTVDLNGCKTTPRNFTLANECFKVVSHTLQACEGAAVNISVSTQFTGNSYYYIGLLDTQGGYTILDSAINTSNYNRSFNLPAQIRPGNYRIMVLEPNLLLGDTSVTYLAVLEKPSALPNQNFTFCAPKAFKMGTAPSNFTHQWFDANGTFFFEGDSLQTGTIFTNTSYQLKRKTKSLNRVGPANTGPAGGSYLSNVDRGNYLKVFRNITIKEAWVDAQSGGWVVAIIRDRFTLREIERDSVWLDFAGWQSIPLNLKVPAGDYFFSASGSTVAGLFRNNAGGLNYPYEIPGVMQITGGNADPSTSFYYYFYNLNVEHESCLSDAAIYSIDPISNLTPPNIQVQGSLNICSGDSVILSVPNTSTNIVEWSNNAQGNSIVVKSSGTYNARFLDGNCNSAFSSSVVVNVTNRPFKPVPTVINNNTCQGGAVLLSGPAGLRYQWSTGDTVQNISVLTPRKVSLITLSGNCASDAADSITVTFRATSTSAINASICKGQSYQLGTQNLTSAGTFNANFINAVGCDSAVTLTLTVKDTSTTRLTREICQGQSFTFGSQLITAAGTYRRTLTNALGCDSTIRLSLNVNSLPIANNLIRAGDTLFAGAGSSIDSVLWFRNGVLFRAQTSARLVLSANDTGTYTVIIVDVSGCRSAFSAPFRVSSITGIDKLEAQVFDIWPNPTSGTVQITGLAPNSRIWVINRLGQTVWQGHLPANHLLPIDALAAGVYQLCTPTYRKSLVVIK